MWVIGKCVPYALSGVVGYAPFAFTAWYIVRRSVIVKLSLIRIIFGKQLNHTFRDGFPPQGQLFHESGPKPGRFQVPASLQGSQGSFRGCNTESACFEGLLAHAHSSVCLLRLLIFWVYVFI